MLYLKCKKRQRKGKVEMEVSAAQSHGTMLAEKTVFLGRVPYGDIPSLRVRSEKVSRVTESRRFLKDI